MRLTPAAWTLLLAVVFRQLEGVSQRRSEHACRPPCAPRSHPPWRPRAHSAPSAAARPATPRNTHAWRLGGCGRRMARGGQGPAACLPTWPLYGVRRAMEGMPGSALSTRCRIFRATSASPRFCSTVGRGGARNTRSTKEPEKARIWCLGMGGCCARFQNHQNAMGEARPCPPAPQPAPCLLLASCVQMSKKRNSKDRQALCSPRMTCRPRPAPPPPPRRRRRRRPPP